MSQCITMQTHYPTKMIQGLLLVAFALAPYALFMEIKSERYASTAFLISGLCFLISRWTRPEWFRQKITMRSLFPEPENFRRTPFILFFEWLSILFVIIGVGIIIYGFLA